MTFALVVIGLLVGAVSGSLLMSIALGTVGYLLGALRSVRAQLTDQGHDIELLRLELRHVRRSGNVAASATSESTAAASVQSERVGRRAVEPHPTSVEQPAPPPPIAIAAAPPALPIAPPALPTTPPAPPTRPVAPRVETVTAVDEPVEVYEPDFASDSKPLPLPSIDERVVAAVRGFFLGGNAAVRVGVLVLIVGVALLAKYAADQGYLPVELRLLCAALIGISLIGVGWRVRTARPAFATTLQGGGVAALYLTTFFALKVYDLIQAPFAFLILVGLTAFSGALAVLQDAKVLAVFGMLGGFLAPIIASTGRGDHVLLFSYYALLNAGIVGVAWFRSWRVLNLLGFAATFGIGTMWGVLSYRPSQFATTEPFLLLFFVFYVAVAILFALRQPPRLRGLVDGTLVFGTPLFAFALQAGLVARYEFGLAWSALGAALFYATCATALVRFAPPLRTMAEAFLALSVGFGTLAIPFAFDNDRMTAASWALEGVGLMWVGIRQQRFLARFAGATLQLLAALAYVAAVVGSQPNLSRLPILNGTCMAALCVGLAGISISWLVYRARDRLHGFEPPVGLLFLAWGLAWWLAAGINEIQAQFANQHWLAARLAWFALTALALELVASRLVFTPARRATLCLLPVGYIALMLVQDALHHPLTAGGQFVWPGTVAILYFLLRRNEAEVGDKVARFLHVMTFWLACIVVVWEVTWQTAHYLSSSTAWPSAAFGAMLALLTGVVLRLRDSSIWPLTRFRATYLTVGLGALAGVGYLWLVNAALLSRAAPDPLFYIPVLNPLDIAIGSALATFVIWLTTLGRRGEQILADELDELAPAILGIAGFAWLNGTIARITHHWWGVTFTYVELYSSMLFQASLSISWTLLALGLMVAGTRLKRRAPWQVGAVLLAVVVAKLVFVDLSTAGTGWRIISFLAVGTLMIVVGWLAPVPPVVANPATPVEEETS